MVQHARQLPGKAIVFIGTGGFKLKTDAKATRGFSASLFRNKVEVLHAADEFDMHELWCSVAMCCNARNLIAAWDHAQEIASSKPRNQDHSGSSTVKSSEIAERMSLIAIEHTMRKTSRFAPPSVSALHAVFPAYSTLEARDNAPDTCLEAYSLNEVQWIKLGPAAGCVGHWKPFAILAAVVVRKLQAGNTVTVCCVYAAFR